MTVRTKFEISDQVSTGGNIYTAIMAGIAFTKAVATEADKQGRPLSDFTFNIKECSDPSFYTMTAVAL